MSNVEVVEQTAKEILKILFGKNVYFITRFEFLPITSKTSKKAEYYSSNGLRHFDVWYNPHSNWIPEIAEALLMYWFVMRKKEAKNYDIPRIVNKIVELLEEQERVRTCDESK